VARPDASPRMHAEAARNKKLGARLRYEWLLAYPNTRGELMAANDRWRTFAGARSSSVSKWAHHDWAFGLYAAALDHAMFK
jgi:hypothetical protein